MFLKSLIGDRDFYRRLLKIAVPIMVQNGITNMVNLLDNVMVGSLGTEQMSGVSIVNQFVFIFNLLIFGAASAAGIFTSQYFGAGDNKGIRHTFRFKVIISFLAGVLGVCVFASCSDALIGTFLHEGSGEGDLLLTLQQGKGYLSILVAGLIPYGLSQAYALTLRETGHPIVPMAASLISVFTNAILNYLFIFGKLGLPPMGVRGAALATVISRLAELLIVVIWSHRHTDLCPWLKGAYRSLCIPGGLLRQIAVKGLPLMGNEVMWATAMTLRNQCYSTRGIDVVAALNISTTVVNLFNVVYMAVGHTLAIIVGGLLGAGKLEEAKSTNRKILAFSVACACGLGALIIAGSSFFPLLYNTSDGVRELARYAMIVSALALPFHAFAHSSYFTLRSGGRVGITVIFDSGYMWLVVMPVCAILAYFTSVPIHLLFVCGQAAEMTKFILGIVLLKRGSWVRCLVAPSSQE